MAMNFRVSQQPGWDQQGMLPAESTPLMSETSSPTIKRAKITLPAADSVYGAMLYLPPIDRLTKGTDWGRSARLAILLCLFNAMLQLGVVRVLDVYRHAGKAIDIRQLLPPDEVVETGDYPWSWIGKATSDSVRKSKNAMHHAFLPPNEKRELEAVHDIDPLCKRIGDGNGTFTCMPHSVKFVFDWDHLDTDGDGIWTLKEAEADPKKLREKRNVAPVTIFNNIINGIKMQADYLKMTGPNKSLYLSPELLQEEGIHKAYFNYWKGDAMMCAMFDPNSCEAAAKQGVFDGALVPGRISASLKGIKDLDSAIQYCYRMLQSGGGCEAALPTDFKRNREQRWGRCGARSLIEGGKYTNPYDPNQSVHVLEATYAQVNAYSRAVSRLYKFFLILVIMLWLLALIDEWKELIKVGEFLVVFPKLVEGEIGGRVIPAAEESDGDEGYRVTAISTKHRIIMTFFYIIRVMVCIILSFFGTLFLLDETDYLSLVMNSLALTFILSIDSMLYGLMENDVKDSVSNCKDIEFRTYLPTRGCVGYCLKKECWGLILVPILAIVLVIHYNNAEREPLLTVLRCACTQEGSKCLDSIQYQGGWWKDYWSKVLPSAMHQIEALRIAGA